MDKTTEYTQEDAAQDMIDLMNSYKMSDSEMMIVAEKLVAMDNISPITIKELLAIIQSRR